jgi:hypothetical protein
MLISTCCFSLFFATTHEQSPDRVDIIMTVIRGTQGLAYKLADELADEIRACEPAGGQPIESCAPFQVNSNFEGPG